MCVNLPLLVSFLRRIYRQVFLITLSFSEIQLDKWSVKFMCFSLQKHTPRRNHYSPILHWEAFLPPCSVCSCSIVVASVFEIKFDALVYDLLWTLAIHQYLSQQWQAIIVNGILEVIISWKTTLKTSRVILHSGCILILHPIKCFLLHLSKDNVCSGQCSWGVRAD